MKTKKILSICFIVLLNNVLFSQDIIYMTDGNEIKAKVVEIDDSDIKYKNFNQQEGPLKNISRSLVFMIKYQDGSIEKFSVGTQIGNDPQKLRDSYSTKTEVIVYFVNLARGWKVDLFHQDQYIGEVKSKEYIRYQCTSGNNLFWASTENKEFLTAELEGGCSYIVYVRPVKFSGFWKVHVELFPLSSDNKDYYPKAIKLIKSKKPLYISKEEITKMNSKLRSFITINLEKYENEWKGKRNFKNISSNQCIPRNELD